MLEDTNPGYTPFGYAGGLYDYRTNLLRFGAWDYFPEIGRWTAEDPIGFWSGDVNFYAYVSNDPVNYVDPSGLSKSSGCGGLLKPDVNNQGGLNLFKWGKLTTTKSNGWKTGDRMLYLTNKGIPKLNWKQNSGYLRQEMRLGSPIFDSYRYSNGLQIPTGGFLRAERYLLENRGWKYNPLIGAYEPPCN